MGGISVICFKNRKKNPAGRFSSILAGAPPRKFIITNGPTHPFYWERKSPPGNVPTPPPYASVQDRNHPFGSPPPFLSLITRFSRGSGRGIPPQMNAPTLNFFFWSARPEGPPAPFSGDQKYPRGYFPANAPLVEEAAPLYVYLINSFPPAMPHLPYFPGNI